MTTEESTTASDYPELIGQCVICGRPFLIRQGMERLTCTRDCASVHRNRRLRAQRSLDTYMKEKYGCA